MKEFYETSKSMAHVSFTSTSGIVTPSKHGQTADKQKPCACGTMTLDNECAVCKCAMEAGIDLRVFKK